MSIARSPLLRGTNRAELEIGDMRIGIVGGTGKEGRGLAIRWARAGHSVFIGSREHDRGVSRARELSAQWGVTIDGGDNASAVASAEIVVLSVPYGAHHDTLTSLLGRLAGQILIDITVPLAPPKVREVHLPPGHSAALEAQALVGDHANVVATLHHDSSAHLADPDHAVDCDVLACGDDRGAVATVVTLIEDLGMRGLDAGRLRNSVALESLTPVLLHLNRAHKSRGTGIRITGITGGG